MNISVFMEETELVGEVVLVCEMVYVVCVGEVAVVGEVVSISQEMLMEVWADGGIDEGPGPSAKLCL